MPFVLRLLLVLTLLCATSVIGLAADKDQAPFQLDKDYFAVKKSPPQAENPQGSSQTTYDIAFFYWYGSAASLQVELALQEYLAANPQVSIKRSPLVARVVWRPQAYIQPILQQLSIEPNDPINQQIYRACIEDCAVFASFEKILDWLDKQLAEVDVNNIEHKSIWRAEKNYRSYAETFSITQVPTIIINEQYRIDANTAQSVDRMMKIMDYLLTVNN